MGNIKYNIFIREYQKPITLSEDSDDVESVIMSLEEVMKSNKIIQLSTPTNTVIVRTNSIDAILVRTENDTYYKSLEQETNLGINFDDNDTSEDVFNLTEDNESYEDDTSEVKKNNVEESDNNIDNIEDDEEIEDLPGIKRSDLDYTKFQEEEANHAESVQKEEGISMSDNSAEKEARKALKETQDPEISNLVDMVD